MRRASVAAFFAFSVGIACSPIVALPLSEAPLNTGCPDEHGCELYVTAGGTGISSPNAQCNAGRCEFGRPDYDFWLVVNVPDSSYYAAARTFVLTNKELSAPQATTSVANACRPPSCVPLPALVPATGRYRVTSAASQTVGLPLPDGTSLPVKVAFVPLLHGTPQEASDFGIPTDAVVTWSRADGNVSYFEAVSVGRYLRIVYPEPPYDAYFPPVSTQIDVTSGFSDDILLGGDKTPLDDAAGDSRKATVTRADGLDGWRVWLIDSTTRRRISSIRPLSGTRMSARLDTVGRSQTGGNVLNNEVDVIVAPPETWLGVPELRSPLIGGQGLESVEVPPLPRPMSFRGVVAVGNEPDLTGIPARLVFTSTRLLQADEKLNSLLQFSTSVASDESGNLTTVLPPGSYDVTIEPAEGTGFSKVKDTLDTTRDRLAKTFRPPPRTVVSGHVVLSDGRALTGAEVLAGPSGRPLTATAVSPRPARTRTDKDGAFRFEVDQGLYDFVVEPQPGTGFPRLVELRSFVGQTADLGEIVVGPPARLSFTLRDAIPSLNPIVRATVRVFALGPGGSTPPVEIARAMTDSDGKCELLLAVRR